MPQWSISDPRRKLETSIEHLIGPDMQPLLLGAVDAVWTLLLGILHVILEEFVERKNSLFFCVPLVLWHWGDTGTRGMI